MQVGNDLLMVKANLERADSSEKDFDINLPNLEQEEASLGENLEEICHLLHINQLATSENKKETSQIENSISESKQHGRVPVFLQDLYEKCCKNIPQGEVHTKLAELLWRQQHAFAQDKYDLGMYDEIKHRIDTGFSAPIRQPFRRTPQRFAEEEKNHLQQQLDAGVLVPSKSPWANPVVLVRKTDGSIRWCGDYRRLNELTRRNAHPLPLMDMCLDCLGSAKLFSTLDLQSGYWQINMHPDDQEKTAVITKYGLYEYTKLPFGLNNAPSTFQRCMELVFRGVQWETLLIYLDDLIIFSNLDYTEHFKRLVEVFQKLADAGLRLKPSKCHLLQTEVLFLGHVVDGQGVRPNPALLEKVRDWPPPRSLGELQHFCGCATIIASLSTSLMK